MRYLMHVAKNLHYILGMTCTSCHQFKCSRTRAGFKMALFHQLLVFAMAISTITACKAKAFSKGADAINYFFAQLGVETRLSVMPYW